MDSQNLSSPGQPRVGDPLIAEQLCTGGEAGRQSGTSSGATGEPQTLIHSRSPAPAQIDLGCSDD